MTETLLQQAIDAIRRGDKATGQRLLAQMLRADSRSETAWLWMSQIVESDAQRLDCLRRILAINPDNAAARKGVALLEARMRGAPPPAPAPARPEPLAQPAPAEPPPQAAPAPPLISVAAEPYAEPEPALPDIPAPQIEPTIVEPVPVVEQAPEDVAAEVRAAPERAEEESRRRAERRLAKRRPIAPILLLVLILVAGGAAAYAIFSSRSSEPVAAPVVSTTGRLVASLDQGGDTDLALIQSDSSNVALLLRRDGADTDPSWSPDGTRIAFTAEMEGALAIAVVGANGQGFTPLTPGDVHSVDPAWSPDGTRIAFASDREGDFDIYVMNSDGTGALNLTRFEGDDRAPAWSPDGRTIVFQSNREGQIDIYRMDADGSGVARLTSDPADDTDPSVSPDGSRIAFVSTRGGDADIFVMNADGAGASDVTGNGVEDRAPSWTPDGAILFTSVITDGAALFVAQPDGSSLSRVADGVTGVSSAAWQPIDVDPATLAAGATSTPPSGAQEAPTAIAPPFDLPEGAFVFASNREGQFDLFRMDFDGENLAVLSDLPNDERHPALSPALSGVEGSQLALDVVFTDTQRIFVVDLGSPATGVITLTQTTESAHSAKWSPDGTLIAYEIDAERGPDVVLVRPDGSGAIRLISRPGYDGCLSWGPEGEQLAFTSDRDGDLNVYLMNVDPAGRGASSGTDVKRLTQHAGVDRCPAWSPDGARIAFISNRNGEGVYLMDAEGANARLLAAISNASQPAWSPDGRFLLVASDQDGDFDVYLIAVDDASIWNLTADSKADEVDPIWTH